MFNTILISLLVVFTSYCHGENVLYETEQLQVRSERQADNQNVWNAALQEHNKYRKRHQSPDLVGDNSLHDKAQQYADYLAANNKFEHSGSRGVGENLAANMASDRVAAMRQAVKQWYDEEPKYNYNNPGYSDATGHFTAVVWKNTQRLGVGVAWNPQRRWWVVVANYSPAGNVNGRQNFEQNVRKPIS